MAATLVRELLASHFASLPLEELTVQRQEFPLWMRADLLHEIERLFAELPEHRFTGARLRHDSGDFRFANLLEEGDDGIAVAPRVTVAHEQGDYLLRGLWLAARELPFAVLWDVYEDQAGTRVRMEVAVPPGAAGERLAGALMKRVRAAGERAESWRGKTIAAGRESHAMTFAPPELRTVPLAPVAREEVILAPGVLELVERNTLAFAAQAEQLVRLGLSGKKGVLLYGPPGTGKTLLARYLATRLEGHTKFLLAADEIEFLPEVLEAARLLAPSMVLIEDVDLIGADRDGPWQSQPATLNTLLNAMDGFGPEARILFVLTTNRPEVLEPALAARPGRVDQSIEIGLPELRERALLVRHFGRGLELEAASADRLARKLGRVSPAFIRELMRRAAQRMLERAGASVEDADLDGALAELSSPHASSTTRLAALKRSPGFA
ncbi:MAG TPA: ATP-binding protein [Burkholderiales bacterium]|nr:ATP-binding protein [Burkholderiales bacterium]